MSKRITISGQVIRNLGWMMKYAREKLGYTEGTLAEQLGISKYAVVKIESGSGEINYPLLEKIEKVLFIKIEWLKGLDKAKFEKKHYDRTLSYFKNMLNRIYEEVRFEPIDYCEAIGIEGGDKEKVGKLKAYLDGKDPSVPAMSELQSIITLSKEYHEDLMQFFPYIAKDLSVRMDPMYIVAQRKVTASYINVPPGELRRRIDSAGKTPEEITEMTGLPTQMIDLWDREGARLKKAFMDMFNVFTAKQVDIYEEAAKRLGRKESEVKALVAQNAKSEDKMRSANDITKFIDRLDRGEIGPRRELMHLLKTLPKNRHFIISDAIEEYKEGKHA